LLEKELYPFHRVCGEYISLESWNFLETLGLPLSDMKLPLIKRLEVSSPDGTLLEHSLPLGGFGISRYKLDASLARIAREAGVDLREGCKVTEVLMENDLFKLEAGGNAYRARAALGSFGKRSNLDLKWKRNFVRKKPGKLDNYIGVKYHVLAEHPQDCISLHNFPHGYCGLSRVESGECCLCYLTSAENLRQCGNDIKRMEQEILFKNPRLARVFSEAKFLWKEPLAIAQVSFSQKNQVQDHILLLGDAAGMIAPLCGNGMSMALHAGKIAGELVDRFLSGEISRSTLERAYGRAWKAIFENRLRTGRRIQRVFGKSWQTNLFVKTIRRFPKLITYLIRQTHGEPF
jgi:menaquinone-9 beta-reductase